MTQQLKQYINNLNSGKIARIMAFVIQILGRWEKEAENKEKTEKVLLACKTFFA